MADLNASEQFALARSSVFTGRLQTLLGQYARAVKNGTVSNPSAASIALADAVQLDPGRMAGLIAISIVSDGSVKGAITSGSGDTLNTNLADTGNPSLDGVIQSIWNSGAWNRLI